MAQIKAGKSLIGPKSIGVYIDGLWRKDCIGRIFKNGSWEDFIYYEKILYDNGVEKVPFSISSPPSSRDFRFTKFSDHYQTFFNNSASGAKGVGFITSTQRINLNAYSKLIVNLSIPTVGSSHSTIIYITPNRDANPEFAVIQKNIIVNPTVTTYELDISEASGDFYIGIAFIVNSGINNPAQNIYKILLN